MGQILEKFRRKEWRDQQVKMVADKIFATLKVKTGKAVLTPAELYIAVLLVFNGINKLIPSAHFDPPTREQVTQAAQNFDLDKDGGLTEDEFLNFINQFSVTTITRAGEKMLYTMVLAPSIATATKKQTENLPVVGKTVQNMPTYMYASLVTFVSIWIHQNFSGESTNVEALSGGIVVATTDKGNATDQGNASGTKDQGNASGSGQTT